MLHPRLIALQGLPGAPAQVARQGLLPVGVQPPDAASDDALLVAGGPWSQIPASQWRRYQESISPAAKRRRQNNETALILALALH